MNSFVSFDMITLKVQIRVKEECISAFKEAMAKNHAGTLKEPGNVRFDVNQGIDDPCQFFLHEVFESRNAHAAHLETDHFKVFMETIESMLEEEMNVVFYNPLFPEDLN